MLPALLLSLIGGTLGAFAARRRGGTGADIAQWSVVWGIIGFLIGFVIVVIWSRMAV